MDKRIISVTRYVTSDGQEFTSKNEAETHDETLKLKKWYEENKLSGASYGSSISWEDLLEWLCENKQQVRKILRCC